MILSLSRKEKSQKFLLKCSKGVIIFHRETSKSITPITIQKAH